MADKVETRGKWAEGLIDYEPLGGPEYRVTARCTRCKLPFTYNTYRADLRSHNFKKNDARIKFNIRKMCPACKDTAKKTLEHQVRDGLSTGNFQNYLAALTGKTLTYHLNSPARPSTYSADPLLLGIRDAADECKHERLPGDKTPDCGCWGDETEWRKRIQGTPPETPPPQTDLPF